MHASTMTSWIFRSGESSGFTVSVAPNDLKKSREKNAHGEGDMSGNLECVNEERERRQSKKRG